MLLLKNVKSKIKIKINYYTAPETIPAQPASHRPMTLFEALLPTIVFAAAVVVVALEFFKILNDLLKFLILLNRKEFFPDPLSVSFKPERKSLKIILF